MKRGLMFGLVALLIFSSMIVSAAESTFTSTMQSALDAFLKGKVDLYPVFKPIVNFILGLTAAVSWEELLVRIALWVMFFVVILGILDFTAFESRGVRYTIALGFMVILSVTRTLGQITTIIFNITRTIQGWDRLWIILAIIVIIIVAAIARKIITRQRRLSDARAKGTLAGSTIKGLNKMAEKTLSTGKEIK